MYGSIIDNIHHNVLYNHRISDIHTENIKLWSNQTNIIFRNFIDLLTLHLLSSNIKTEDKTHY